MFNPFKEIVDEDNKDLNLIAKSLDGDLPSLESLILRHQSWIYNIAIRMVYDSHDAEDVTQEVLIKIITKLSQFNSEKSSFRTWLYRIVVNHIINMKSNKKESFLTEAVKHNDFENFTEQISDKRRAAKPESNIILEEVKMSCIQCMLLILTRRERMVFILGVVFNVADSVGSEICEVTKVNFRKILSRSRDKVFNFFNKNCSLLNEDNPCQCSDLVQPIMDLKLLNKEDLTVEKESHGKVRDIISSSVQNLEDSYYEFISLYRNQPFLKSPDMIQFLRTTMDRDDIRELFHIH